MFWYLIDYLDNLENKTLLPLSRCLPSLTDHIDLSVSMCCAVSSAVHWYFKWLKSQLRSIKQKFSIYCISSANNIKCHMAFSAGCVHLFIHGDECGHFYCPCTPSSPGDKISTLHLRLLHQQLFAIFFFPCFFHSCDHCWFYVTFLSGWLLKWDLTFHAPSWAATMTGLRTTVKMDPRVGGIYRMLLWLGGLISFSRHQWIFTKSFSNVLAAASARFWGFGAFSSPFFISYCQPFVIRIVFMESQAAFRSTELYSSLLCHTPLLSLSCSVSLN